MPVSANPPVPLVGAERWLRRLDPRVALKPGQPGPAPLRVPVDDARWMLRGTARAVAGVPDKTPQVVWTAGASELLVRLDGIGIACAPGVVTIFLAVACDQLPDGASIEVGFGVGTEAKATGLVMSTFDRPTGPDVVVDVWAESLTAFAWESLLRLAETLCAAVGRDAAGHPLVPASLGADRGVLLAQPMARRPVTHLMPPARAVRAVVRVPARPAGNPP
jgi:hypothetical protein